MCIYKYVYINIYANINMCIHTYVYMNIYEYINKHEYINMSIYKYAHIYVQEGFISRNLASAYFEGYATATLTFYSLH